MRFDSLRALTFLTICVASCVVDHGGLVEGGSCVDDRDCSGGCFIQTCVNEVCESTGVSDCPAGEQCMEGECRVIDTCDEVLCATERSEPSSCRVGVCVDGDCDVESTCTDDQTCCGGTCVTCESDNPCMVSRCDEETGGCVQVPRAEGFPCDTNDLYCDGVGTCDATGACVDVARPCEDAPEACDEDRDRCVGCVTDAGCPDIVEEVDCNALDWPPQRCGQTVQRNRTQQTCQAGLCVDVSTVPEDFDCDRPTTAGLIDCDTLAPVVDCDFGSNICTNTDPGGSRTTFRFRCNAADECIREDIVDPDFECRRNQDGMSCGDTEPGTCGGFDDVCDETGTRDRIVPACASGSCDRTPTPIACSRDTDGDSCGATDPGVCGGFDDVCDETGTRNEVVPSCASGSCNTTPTAVACMRDTDGDSCGSTDPGVCGGFTDVCDETGTRNEVVPRCQSGSCNTTPTAVMCTRDTDGDSCGTGTVVSPWSSCAPPDGMPNSCAWVQTRTRMVSMCTDGGCATTTTTQTRNCSPGASNGESCGSAGACFSADASACEGTRSVPVCMGGTCTMRTQTCTLIANGEECRPSETGPCVPNNPTNECSNGTQTTTVYTCQGGTCTGTGGAVSLCSAEGEACGDPTACIAPGAGTCMSQSCQLADPCAGQCMPMCTGGESCTCGGVGATRGCVCQ